MSSTAPPSPSLPTLRGRLTAEAAGTFLLVFAVVGTATFTAAFPGDDAGNPLGVGLLGVAVALGAAVMIGAYAFGPISGGHFNPAVSLGLAAAGRFAWRDVVPYVVAQLVGAAAGAATVFLVSRGGSPESHAGAVEGGFVSNGFGDLSPSGFGLGSALAVEVVVTAIFVTVILGVTHARAAQGFAPLAIGATLTVLLLVTIPVDNASLNPARALATALFAGGDWIAQVWVFLLAPTLGGIAAGIVHRVLFETDPIAASAARPPAGARG